MGGTRTEINGKTVNFNCLDDDELKFFNSLSRNKILSMKVSSLKNTLS